MKFYSTWGGRRAQNIDQISRVSVWLVLLLLLFIASLLFSIRQTVHLDRPLTRAGEANMNLCHEQLLFLISSTFASSSGVHVARSIWGCVAAAWALESATTSRGCEVYQRFPIRANTWLVKRKGEGKTLWN